MFTKRHYIEAEEQFYKALLGLLDSEIRLYCVTGSLGRNDIIPGWSDIDVLLVVKDYSKNTFDCINKALSAARGGIKIGTTIFSSEEFNHAFLKDSKTHISEGFIKDGYYKPRIISPEIRLSKGNKILRRYMDISDFSKFSHEMKRELLRIEEYNEPKVYKLVISSLKILLYQAGVVAMGYQDTLGKAPEYLPNFDLQLLSPEELLNSPEKSAKRYFIYLDFLEWVRVNADSIFRDSNWAFTESQG